MEYSVSMGEGGNETELNTQCIQSSLSGLVCVPPARIPLVKSSQMTSLMSGAGEHKSHGRDVIYTHLGGDEVVDFG